jgi:hypothetical protein
MAKSGSAASAPLAYCTDAGTVQVLLGDQPAAGLFVLFRVAPPPADAEHTQAKILSVAGANPAAPFTLCFVDGQGFLQKVASDGNPWHDIASQLPDLEAAVAGNATKSSKSKTKKTAKALPRSCESEKLHAEVDYELAFVAHPSLKVAKAAKTFLETGEATSPYVFPEDKTSMLVRGKLKLVQAEGTQQLTLPIDGLAGGKKLPDLFWPKGSARYDGWVLFRLMPYDHLDEVRKQVAKLCEDLGALRLPSSTSQKGPYPPTGAGESQFGVNIAAIVARFQQDVADGRGFQLAKAAGASGALPKDALPAGWRSLSPRPSWNWLCGSLAELKDKPWVFGGEQVHAGVVDARVGDAIAGMIGDKLRHPGAVLIEIPSTMEPGGPLWGRPELVFSIEMLRVLLVRFGVPYGASMTHTYRPIQAKGGTGRAECSNHKLGLAVDFAICSASGGKADIQDHGHPAEYFPVRYEAVYSGPSLEALEKRRDAAAKTRLQAETNVTTIKTELAKATTGLAGLQGAQAAAQRKTIADLSRQQQAAEKKLARAEKDENTAAEAVQRRHANEETKADRTLSWVICAHSHWDIFGADQNAESIAAELAKRLGKPDKDDEAWDAENEYENVLHSGFPSEPTGLAADLIKEYLGKMRSVCTTLTAMDPLEFRHQLFRRTVRQFLYNPFERDGGDEGSEIAADSDDAWRTAMVDVKAREKAFHHFDREKHHSVHSFVNFSRLANECDLWGITAQPGNPTTKGSFRNPMTDPAIPVKPPARVTYEINKQTFSPIAGLLEALKSAGKEAPDDQIDLAYPDGTTVSMKASEMDIDFVVAWAEEMGKEQKDRIGKPKPGEKWPPPVVGWDGPDAVILGHPEVLDEVKAIFKERGSKTFRVVSAGKDASSAFAIGKEIAGEAILEAFGNYIKALKARQGSPKPGQPSTKKSNTDYSITIRPIFRETGDALLPYGATITLPAHGVPAPLEWWHYEQGLRARDTYGKNVEDLGFARDWLVTEKSPPAGDVAPEVGGFGYPAKKMENKRTLHRVTTAGAVEGAAEEQGADAEGGSDE